MGHCSSSCRLVGLFILMSLKLEKHLLWKEHPQLEHSVLARCMQFLHSTGWGILVAFSVSYSAHHFVNHSIYNCTALFFNAVALVYQSDPNSIWQCICPLVNHTSLWFWAVIACTSCLQMCTAQMRYSGYSTSVTSWAVFYYMRAWTNAILVLNLTKMTKLPMTHICVK